MKRITCLVLLAILAGCANNPRPVVPSLEGKPRVPINTQVPSSPEAAPVIIEEGE